MKNNFRGYYIPTEEEFADLWANCVFILDANVLLNLYRYPKEARDDLFKIFKKISSRLWVPYQAALEYQENRLKVVSEQLKRFAEVIKLLDGTENTMKSGLEHLQLEKRHSIIDPEPYIAKITKGIHDFRDNLMKLRENQPDVHEQDYIREFLDGLLNGKIGPKPKDQAELDQIYKQGEIRYSVKRPPGYMDINKSSGGEPESYCYGGLYYKRIYGDLILWFQIIEQAKRDDSFRKIVFITDDDKEDWWWVAESGGLKTIGPRPELIDEIMEEAAVSAFHMYNSERFLSYGAGYFSIRLSKGSVQQVKEVTEKPRLKDIVVGARKRLGRFAEQAVFNWLTAELPDNALLEIYDFPDFVVVDAENGKKTGYEVKYVSEPAQVNFWIRDFSGRGAEAVDRGIIDEFKMVLVASDERVLFGSLNQLSKSPLGIVDLRNIIPGLLSFDDKGVGIFSPYMK